MVGRIFFFFCMKTRVASTILIIVTFLLTPRLLRHLSRLAVAVLTSMSSAKTSKGLRLSVMSITDR